MRIIGKINCVRHSYAIGKEKIKIKLCNGLVKLLKGPSILTSAMEQHPFILWLIISFILDFMMVGTSAKDSIFEECIRILSTGEAFGKDWLGVWVVMMIVAIPVELVIMLLCNAYDTFVSRIIVMEYVSTERIAKSTSKLIKAKQIAEHGTVAAAVKAEMEEFKRSSNYYKNRI